jgi:NAD+ synthase (glutamine-hydrolysing)
MDRILVAAAALNQTPLAWEENCAHIRTALKEAQAAGAQIVCLPELCVSGYGCEDAFHSSGVVAEALALAVELAKETKGLIANFGVPLIVQGAVYNTVAVAVDGVLRGFVAKQHLPGDGIHYEPRWFKPWQRGVVSTVEVNGTHLPVGDIFFEVDGIRIGFEICEDAWVAERPGIFLAQHGVDLILNPSASHFAFAKHEVRKRFVAEGSRVFGASYVYANLLGCESGRVIYDGDTLISSHGEIIAQGERLSFADVKLLTGVVDIDRSRLLRRRQSSFRPQFEAGERLVRVDGFSIKRTAKRTSPRAAAWESSPEIKHEEFTRAVALGLFDYLRKSRSEGFVISLSGGVDSSAASCLVALMIQAAVKELGLQNFKNKLSYIALLSKARSEEELVRGLLACAYQATKNSSQTTHKAAQELARELGATFYDLNVDKLVDEYTSIVSAALGTKLSWKEHDTALQNIQARVRSPSIWLIANLRRALLLTTSNRSEAAVGYTTMDGDSSGGLSPLGGIDKAYLRVWLSWLEKTGPLGLRKYPSLKLVNEQAPTAELRPSAARQTDEGDLMPYRVLDVIERYAVRDKLLPQAVFQALSEDFAGEFLKEDLRHWVIRFFTLWSTNQWKRERYAPSFHLDDESVDPKTWCRFPILSGGFKKELAELASLPVGKRVVKASGKTTLKKKATKGKR